MQSLRYFTLLLMVIYSIRDSDGLIYRTDSGKKISEAIEILNCNFDINAKGQSFKFTVQNLQQTKTDVLVVVKYGITAQDSIKLFSTLDIGDVKSRNCNKLIPDLKRSLQLDFRTIENLSALIVKYKIKEGYNAEWECEAFYKYDETAYSQKEKGPCNTIENNINLYKDYNSAYSQSILDSTYQWWASRNTNPIYVICDNKYQEIKISPGYFFKRTSYEKAYLIYMYYKSILLGVYKISNSMTIGSNDINFTKICQLFQFETVISSLDYMPSLVKVSEFRKGKWYTRTYHLENGVYKAYSNLDLKANTGRLLTLVNNVNNK